MVLCLPFSGGFFPEKHLGLRQFWFFGIFHEYQDRLAGGSFHGGPCFFWLYSLHFNNPFLPQYGINVRVNAGAYSFLVSDNGDSGSSVFLRDPFSAGNRYYRGDKKMFYHFF